MAFFKNVYLYGGILIIIASVFGMLAAFQQPELRQVGGLVFIGCLFTTLLGVTFIAVSDFFEKFLDIHRNLTGLDTALHNINTQQTVILRAIERLPISADDIGELKRQATATTMAAERTAYAVEILAESVTKNRNNSQQSNR